MLPSEIEEYVIRMKQNHPYMKSGVWENITLRPARKYIKVCSVLSNGQVSIIEFIDPVTLDVYKAKSWKQRGRLINNLKSY